MPSWTFNYDPTGGYDCMTSGIHIKYNGETILTLDFAIFNQEHCTNAPVEMQTRGTTLAQFITTKLNEAQIKGPQTWQE
jgi:hypothetical protein